MPCQVIALPPAPVSLLVPPSERLEVEDEAVGGAGESSSAAAAGLRGNASGNPRDQVGGNRGVARSSTQEEREQEERRAVMAAVGAVEQGQAVVSDGIVRSTCECARPHVCVCEHLPVVVCRLPFCVPRCAFTN